MQRAADRQKVTINMVADRAGVSRGTVDRVLNGRDGVKPESREKVLEAIRELRYVSNKIERLTQVNPGQKKEYTCIGLLIPFAAADFAGKVYRGIEDARKTLEPLGGEIIIEKCETQLLSESLEKLEKLAERGAQGIAMTAINVRRVKDKINDLVERGIPVVTYNSDIPGSRRSFFVGENGHLNGRIAGNLAIKLLGGREGNILAVVGNRDYDAHERRLEGCLEFLQEKGFGMDRIRIVETYNDYINTFNLVKNALIEDKDIKLIYLVNESVAGCMEAIERAEREEKVFCICHDLSPASKVGLKCGDIDFAITQDMYQQGYLSPMLIYEILQRGTDKGIEMETPRAQIACCENYEYL